MSWLDSVLVTAERVIYGRARADLRWWQRRARRRGARAVYHRGHSPAVLEQVTARQVTLLFPLLEHHLRGNEKVILDFGCGPGRFTPGLAELIGGQAIGVDPIQSLLDLAPRHPAVEYHAVTGQHIPLASNSVDVAWICLVLMTITDPRALQQSLSELRRVLKRGGLVFLVENTEPRPHSAHLRYRSVEDYAALLPWAQLRHVTDYEDAGERISVMVGRTA